MSATKSDAINIFTCQKNRNYLRSIMPSLKNVPEDQLQRSVNAFALNFISYTSSTQSLWEIVRYLNRLYVQDVDPNPSTAQTFSAVGEAIWFTQEVNNGLNSMWDRCGEGASQFDGTTWSDSAQGGYMTECSGQPNINTTCCDNNRFTWYRNKFIKKDAIDHHQ